MTLRFLNKATKMYYRFRGAEIKESSSIHQITCLNFIIGHMDDSPRQTDIYWLNNLLSFMKIIDALPYSTQHID
jgi:hypothetical protein